MRATTPFCCANLRTLGLDITRPHTAAEIKAAFVEKAKSIHPDAGGDAARFRQLKDAYDALRGVGGGAGGAAGKQPSYPDPYPDAAASRTQQSRRSHIYTERYNDGAEQPQSERGTWDYGSGTRYANNSTRSFYRPYSSNYYDPSATGFTREEVARAELAMRLHMLKRILWNCFVYGSALYLLYEYMPRLVGVDEREKTRGKRELWQTETPLPAHCNDTQRAHFFEEWSNRSRDDGPAATNGHRVLFDETASARFGDAASDQVTAEPPRIAPNTPQPFPSPDTYCDVADEDIDVD